MHTVLLQLGRTIDRDAVAALWVGVFLALFLCVDERRSTHTHTLTHARYTREVLLNIIHMPSAISTTALPRWTLPLSQEGTINNIIRKKKRWFPWGKRTVSAYTLLSPCMITKSLSTSLLLSLSLDP